MFANTNTSKPSIQWSQPFGNIEFSEILAATNNFDESLVIGGGGFGKVYKGNIINGPNLVVAAIKRLGSMSDQGATEFWAEVNMLSMLRHCNIVSLIGYCIHEQEKILVYEFMPNGTLDDHLHKLCTPLSWLRRLNICIGAGRGLRYLHNDTGLDSGVIHSDFKSSNILLHGSWAAKISDFGLSKTCPTNQPSTHVKTRVKGTYGYFDPVYYQTGMLTRKSDVYAFGVILLEVLCRKRAVDGSLDKDQWGLVPWAQDYIKEGNLKHIIDSDIRSEISPQCLKQFVKTLEICLNTNPKQRPTMAEVVASLESALTLQEKFNMQAANGTIFDRVVNMLPSPSNGENSVQGDLKLSIKSKGNYEINRVTIRAINNMFPEIKEVPADSQIPSQSVNELRFDDLYKATKEFCPDFLLAVGRFRKVFLGWVDKKTFSPSKHGDGIAIAVKRFHQENCQGYAEWLAEMNFLGELAHPNIIRLLGYCRDEHKRLLVYEYMPNKSFDRFLFTDGPFIGKPLSWGTRLWIMIGVARGLAYLHVSEQIILRDLKSSNILLDKDFNAKLGDFGLAKYGPETWETNLSARSIGPHGYIAPEFYMTGQLSMKSDIYSFGVVLWESITGRRALDPNLPVEEQNLVDSASVVQSNRRNLKEIMDPRLEHKYSVQGAFECAALVLRCVANIPKDRPSSEEVLQSLEQIYALYK